MGSKRGVSANPMGFSWGSTIDADYKAVQMMSVFPLDDFDSVIICGSLDPYTKAGKTMRPMAETQKVSWELVLSSTDDPSAGSSGVSVDNGMFTVKAAKMLSGKNTLKGAKGRLNCAMVRDFTKGHLDLWIRVDYSPFSSGMKPGAFNIHDSFQYTFLANSTSRYKASTPGTPK